jgi:hypothetical protein
VAVSVRSSYIRKGRAGNRVVTPTRAGRCIECVLVKELMGTNHSRQSGLVIAQAWLLATVIAKADAPLR